MNSMFTTLFITSPGGEVNRYQNLSGASGYEDL